MFYEELKIIEGEIMPTFKDARALGNAEYPFISIGPGPLWPRVVAPEKVLSMSQIELNCVTMLNCNCLKPDCFYI